jgi:hypothetical protein
LVSSLVIGCPAWKGILEFTVYYILLLFYLCTYSTPYQHSTWVLKGVFQCLLLHRELGSSFLNTNSLYCVLSIRFLDSTFGEFHFVTSTLIKFVSKLASKNCLRVFCATSNFLLLSQNTCCIIYKSWIL